MSTGRLRAGGENGSGDGDEEWSAMLAGDETNEWRRGRGNERTDGQMDGRTRGSEGALGFESTRLSFVQPVEIWQGNRQGRYTVGIMCPLALLLNPSDACAYSSGWA